MMRSDRGPAARRLCARLTDRLDAADARGLRRSLRRVAAAGPVVQRGGRGLINLASNDYLGLSVHPRVCAAASAASANAAGAGASRLVAGHLDIHAEAEARLAAFKRAEAALLLPTGYTANLAVLGALPERGDLVCLDKFCHASLIDAAQSSPATLRTYPHLDLERARVLLGRHRGSAPAEATRFLVTESVFSMDGDTADLPALLDLADECDAVLVVDEAHGTGTFGATGAGLAEHQGVLGRVPITVSTASKALGGLGGVVTADRPVVDTLINFARPFIYTTAPPPAQAAAIIAALDVIGAEPGLRARLHALTDVFRKRVSGLGWRVPPAETATPIIPLITGTTAAAVRLAAALLDHGVLAVAIRPPTVPKGAARVRLSLRADLSDGEVERAIGAIDAATHECPPPGG